MSEEVTIIAAIIVGAMLLVSLFIFILAKLLRVSGILIEGAVSLWHWALEWSFVGFALYILCWVFAPIIMIIVCLIVGYLGRKSDQEFLDQSDKTKN